MTASPSNEEIASALAEYAALLELSGASGHAVRAFRRGAGLVRGTPLPIADLVRSGRVRELRGVGPGLERRMRELVETGRIAELDDLRQTISPELAAFGRMHGLSANRLLAIGAALGIRTVAELRAAAQEGRLAGVPGIGPHTEGRIVSALAAPAPPLRTGLMLDRARALCEPIAEARSMLASRGIATSSPRSATPSRPAWNSSPSAGDGSIVTRLAKMVAVSGA